MTGPGLCTDCDSPQLVIARSEIPRFVGWQSRDLEMPVGPGRSCIFPLCVFCGEFPLSMTDPLGRSRNPAILPDYRPNRIIARHTNAMMITLLSDPFLRSSFRVSQQGIFLMSGMRLLRIMASLSAPEGPACNSELARDMPAATNS